MNFRLKAKQRLRLIGPNGSGKSTLMHLLMGLNKPDSGTIRILGQPMRGEKDFKLARQQMGFVFQNANDQLFSPTVIEDVAFGLLNMGKPLQKAVELSRKRGNFHEWRQPTFFHKKLLRHRRHAIDNAIQGQLPLIFTPQSPESRLLRQ
ncbi:CbiO: cobalt import ABC-binding protein [Desulfosarcina variabilis str. Montpellier]|uniref:ATP-binding cassette domain-containing protein n=1 Tax=Desulfosarcina variabilis TaxID=2300 RepID=UPI003AFAAAB1